MQRVSCQIAVYIAKLKRWKIACVHYLTLPYHINGKFKIEIRSLIWVSYCISLWCSLCVCLFVWFFFFICHGHSLYSMSFAHCWIPCDALRLNMQRQSGVNLNCLIVIYRLISTEKTYMNHVKSMTPWTV